MSPFKLLIAAVVGLCVTAVAAILVVGYFNSDSRVDAGKPAAPAAPQPAAAAVLEPSTKEFFDDCVRGGAPTTANAEQRVAACSKALQSRQLTPSEVALARLTRGAARTVLGDKIMASDDYTEALKHYDSAIDPANPDALNMYRRGASLDALGQTDRALTDYGAAIRLDPKSTRAYFGRGVLLASRTRAYDRAIADFDKVLALEPDNVDALIRRGDAYSQLGQPGRALADLDRAVVLAPGNAQAYVFRGLAQSRRGEPQLAVKDYDAALQRNPREINALVNRAAIHANAGQQDLAIRDLDAALAIDKNNPVALYNRGYARFAKREFDQAIADYGAALELDPYMGLAYNNRCLTRAIDGRDLVRALADCDAALKLMPLNLDVRDTRGFTYLKLGDPALAINEYNAALDIDPNRTIALFGRGLARIRNGQTTEGEADQAAAKVLDPEVERRFSAYGLK